eukprot:NODE_1655_length_1263_cov_160.101232_g1640_i0.p1 GENE.NODE_1655_length_1263_cov_160.101232_g1640_i0~~NODE_1655_length_1263_cov_160.101232_g1640_i0.p1  ORF type:complete len:272 (+),score=29.85 NODE_1655_length_1263_cov_160.101232_g1640_i0:92-907(+)
MAPNTASSTITTAKSFPGGGRFEGQFSGNLRDGYGVFFFPNGDVYRGYWKGDRKSGFGTAQFADGQKYEGYWDSGMKNGRGTFWFNGGNVYEGEWKDDRKNGTGCAKFASGNRYEGQWSEDSMCGKGTFYYANGDVYSGDWNENKKDGVGIWRSHNGADQYEGQWKGDLRHGCGTLWHDGQILSVNYDNGRMVTCFPLENGPDSPLCTGAQLIQHIESGAPKPPATTVTLQPLQPSVCAPECKASAPFLPCSLVNAQASEPHDERIVICVM